jgi:alpha-D-ribose 1-methylphosphonate 5-triphosphate diphosphatase
MSGIESESNSMNPAMTTVIENAQIVLPEAVVDGRVYIADGQIVAIETRRSELKQRGDSQGQTRRRIDAGGNFLLPGLVDLHGDDIEHHLYPRNGAQIDARMALTTADRATVAAGITTKFHAIAFEDAPDKNRSLDRAVDLTETVGDDKSLLADHRVHARCEVTEHERVRAVGALLDRGLVDLVSVMAHVPGQGQFRTREQFLTWQQNAYDMTAAEAEQLLEKRAALSDETLTQRIDQIVRDAQNAGVVVASHDDDHPAEVERLYEQGITISEYPITLDAAQRAHELGMTTVMGAPNFVRGESLFGNLRSATAIAEGVTDTLCVDYHPPSLLAAPFVDTGEPLPERVARVTRNPAEAVGLTDRGRIEEGARADLIVVDPEPVSTVTHAFVGGHEVYRTEVPR